MLTKMQTTSIDSGCVLAGHIMMDFRVANLPTNEDAVSLMQPLIVWPIVQVGLSLCTSTTCMYIIGHSLPQTGQATAAGLVATDACRAPRSGCGYEGVPQPMGWPWAWPAREPPPSAPTLRASACTKVREGCGTQSCT